MQVTTKNNGIVNVEENKIVYFPDGILGFEKNKMFALIESEYEPFINLQSVDDKNLSFLMVDPFLICPNYEVDIDDESLNKLETSSPEDIIIMTIVTIPSDSSNVTANFLGPIVINRKNNLCMQYILQDNRWTTKFDVIKALKNQSAAGKGE